MRISKYYADQHSNVNNGKLHVDWLMNFAVDIFGFFLGGGVIDRPLCVTSNRCIPVKNALAWSTVAWDNTVIFCSVQYG